MATDSNGSARGQEWALILGASSGFGAATAVELAKNGLNIFGVHLDLRATVANVTGIVGEIEAAGRQAAFFNVNAADAGKRLEVMDAISDRLAADGGHIAVLMHSLAFGTLKPTIATEADEALNQRQFDMTIDVMANSLVYWAQEVMIRGHFRRGSRIFAMTSSGATRVLRSYGAVSAAKAALESHIRQLAFELAPQGVTANAIRAGITDTPALRRIPEGPGLLERTAQYNPSGRATVPEDIARAIAVLKDERLYWMTGNVIGVDGGEEIAV